MRPARLLAMVLLLVLCMGIGHIGLAADTCPTIRPTSTAPQRLMP
ncbi:MAG TPA: hypothetical protein VK464_12440 [Symbiobacteriaceae bacterium]|nr:hypothetical protein [Symbiobacteriaceae bacterium]